MFGSRGKNRETETEEIIGLLILSSEISLILDGW